MFSGWLLRELLSSPVLECNFHSWVDGSVLAPEDLRELDQGIARTVGLHNLSLLASEITSLIEHS